MKGTAFVKTLPPHAGPAREQMILDAVRRRDIAPIKWSTVSTRYGPYMAHFRVSTDALRVGDADDSVRVTVNHETAQRIADELGVVLPTAQLNDEIWAQADVHVSPLFHSNWVNDGTMSDTGRMLEQHQLIENAVAAEHAKGNRGLIADVGKDWVTTKRLWLPPPMKAGCEQGPIRSANYGWHSASAPYTAATEAGGHVYQPVGLCHGLGHTDYSQMVRLVQRGVTLCEEGWSDPACRPMDIDWIASDPQLAPLVSHEGPIEEMRHPAIKRSCEPGVRCPETLLNDVMLRSASCALDCQKLSPPAPDPTESIQTTVARAAVAHVAPMLIAAAVGFVGTLWWVSRS